MTSERQTKSMQLSIDLGTSPYNNQYLFADRYLDHILTGDERWPAGLAEAEAFLGWLRDLYEHEREHLAAYSEHQLEQVWFRPILAHLGHVWQEQARVPGLGSGIRQPDYVFFPAEAARQAALSAQKTEEYAQHALAVGEVKAWDVHLSKKRRAGSPTFDAQNPSYQIDYYIKATGLTWGILSNGRQWRLVHRESSYRLDTYYEVDLIALVERGSASAMRYFTMFFHQAAFQEDAQGRVFLNDVLAGSRAYAIALEEDLRENAYLALEQLMQGFYDYTPNRLEPDDLHAVYENSLYLLYRLLFVLYGESRGLLPVENLRYRELFSFLEFKQEIAEQIDKGTYIPKRTNKYYGQLSVLFHIINGDDPGLSSEINVARYNGGLFDPRQHTFLAEKSVGDQAFTRAVDLLCRRRSESGGMEFVDYRTLNVRHLGSIYEGLLEYQPRRAAEAMVAVPISSRNGSGEQWVVAAQAPRGAKALARRAPGDIYLETDKGERKATGSYYTPQYIVEYIVEQTLGPLVARVRKQTRSEGEPYPNDQAFVDAILNLKILDPAMGSGHFLVDATDYLARVLATDPYVQTEEAPNKSDLNYWQRLVVERCIYGVDKNPLAVELAKLSLWLTTFVGDKPLGFLDHHLACGDSLVGADVADLGAAPPPALDRRRNNRVAEGQMNLFAYLLSQRLPVVMSKIMAIIDQESDSYESVHAKETANRAIQRLKAPFESVANLWTSAYFGNQYAPNDYQETLNLLHAPETLLMMKSVQAAEAIAAEHRFFHWELAFPEVFFDMQGQPLGKAERGFDAVIGNPPYVRQEQIVSNKVFLRSHYDVYHGMADLYIYFIERGLDVLREKGMFGFIVSNKFMRASYGHRLRRTLTSRTQLQQIVDFGELPVFKEAAAFPAIVLLHKNYVKHQKVNVARIKTLDFEDLAAEISSSSHTVKDKGLADGGWSLADTQITELLIKLEKVSMPLKKYIQGEMYRGISTGLNEAFFIDQATRDRLIAEHADSRDLIKPLIMGDDVRKFRIEYQGRYIIFTRRGVNIDHYPAIKRHLQQFQAKLEPCTIEDNIEDNRACQGRKPGNYTWYEIQDTTDYWTFFEQPKIVYPDIAKEARFALDLEQFYPANTVYVIPRRDDYLLSLLNSNLSFFFMQRKSTVLGDPENRGRLRFIGQYMEQLPIRRIDFTTPEDKRALLMATARRYYEAGEHDALLAFTAARLEAEPAQRDVIHDLLAYLAQQMTDLHVTRQRLEAANDPFKYLDRSASFVKFTDAFSDAIKYGQRINCYGREEMPVALDKVHHDIDGMRLIPEGDEWRLEIQLKRRDPDTGWREWQHEGDGHLIARAWMAAYRFPLPEKQARYYQIALPVRDEFTNAASFPGGYTRSTAKKLALTRVPAFDPDVNLAPLLELRAELADIRARIAAADALIDQIVYQLYDLTPAEIKIVESAIHTTDTEQAQEEGDV
ncbi:MAG: Eco57I restriction-modification methylase domain-containing protein [Anaerolineales bacterium]